MSALLLDPPPTLDRHFERERPLRLDDVLYEQRADAHGRLTLDELITSVWEGLAVRDAVRCPVCDGAMTSSTHDSGLSAGACVHCGSLLS
jgi:hypothetical protein